jgi:Tol biopolymer transport system component
VTSTGEQAYGGDSTGASISADGRFVAFHSSAGNLSPGGGFGTVDVIVFDVARNVTSRLRSAGTSPRTTVSLRR